MSLTKQYETARSFYIKVEKGEEIESTDAVPVITNALRLVEENSVFSKNEELDDITTSSLKVSYSMLVA